MRMTVPCQRKMSLKPLFCKGTTFFLTSRNYLHKKCRTVREYLVKAGVKMMDRYELTGFLSKIYRLYADFFVPLQLFIK